MGANESDSVLSKNYSRCVFSLVRAIRIIHKFVRFFPENFSCDLRYNEERFLLKADTLRFYSSNQYFGKLENFRWYHALSLEAKNSRHPTSTSAVLKLRPRKKCHKAEMKIGLFEARTVQKMWQKFDGVKLSCLFLCL